MDFWSKTVTIFLLTVFKIIDHTLYIILCAVGTIIDLNSSSKVVIGEDFNFEFFWIPVELQDVTLISW